MTGDDQLERKAVMIKVLGIALFTGCVAVWLYAHLRGRKQ